jgi:hypothetical protein
MNRQRILNIAGTYGVTDQFSSSINIPYLVHGEWGHPIPSADTVKHIANGPRWNQNTSGLGDISISGKYWFLNTHENPDQNIMLGVGIKIPTGNSNVQVLYPNQTGADSTVKLRSADQSIQPGDGGWGFPLELQAFKAFGKFTVFANAVYLINPRDTNETLSSTSDAKVTADRLYRVHNTVQDQYLFRIGIAYQLSDNISLSIAEHTEGVPAKDLIGRSDGFRRVGVASFIEPGIVYNSASFGSISASVPITYFRNRPADSYGNAGDATFADFIVLIGYSYRF